MSLVKSLGSGLLGACVLTLIHESARRMIPEAPRMDILGMRAIARSLRAMGSEVPPADDLFGVTLAGDIVSNAAYYSLVGAGGADKAVMNGTLLGLAAGIGAVLLPGPMGLGEGPSARTTETKLMTVGWYTAGGVAAGLAYSVMAGKDRSA